VPSLNFLARRSLNVRCLSSLPASQNQPERGVKVPQMEPRQAVGVKEGGTLAVVVVVVALVVAEQDVVDVP